MEARSLAVAGLRRPDPGARGGTYQELALRTRSSRTGRPTRSATGSRPRRSSRPTRSAPSPA